MTRASVRQISGFAGINPPRDVIDLQLHQDPVYVGSEVNGSIRVLGNAPIKSVHLQLEGIEYSVISLPKEQKNGIEIEELRRKTTERRIILKEELLIDCSKPKMFQFLICETLPPTTKFRLENSDPTLPSQFQIKYTVTATIYGNSSKTQVAHTLTVLAKEEVDVPISQTVTLSIKSNIDFLFKSIFSCGDKMCVSADDTDMATIAADDSYIILEPNPKCLHLVAGQLINIFVRDWLGIFSHPDNVWMIRLVERRTWKSQGRVSRSRDIWDLKANHQELPTSIRCSYDRDPQALLKVSHEMVVYVVRKGAPKNVLATTEPVQVRIATSSFTGEL